MAPYTSNSSVTFKLAYPMFNTNPVFFNVLIEQSTSSSHSSLLSINLGGSVWSHNRVTIRVNLIP